MRNRLLGIEVWAGLVLLGLAIVYWFQADALPNSVLGGSVGAAGMPELLAVALGVMACVLVAQSLLASDAARSASRAMLPSRMEFLRAMGIWLISLCFVLILPWAGYPVSVAGILIVIAMYYGRRPSPVLIAFAIGGAVVFYLLFTKLLGVPMPLGIWPDLFTR